MNQIIPIEIIPITSTSTCTYEQLMDRLQEAILQQDTKYRALFPPFNGTVIQVREFMSAQQTLYKDQGGSAIKKELQQYLEDFAVKSQVLDNIAALITPTEGTTESTQKTLGPLLVKSQEELIRIQGYLERLDPTSRQLFVDRYNDIVQAERDFDPTDSDAKDLSHYLNFDVNGRMDFLSEAWKDACEAYNVCKMNIPSGFMYDWLHKINPSEYKKIKELPTETFINPLGAPRPMRSPSASEIQIQTSPPRSGFSLNGFFRKLAPTAVAAVAMGAAILLTTTGLGQKGLQNTHNLLTTGDFDRAAVTSVAPSPAAPSAPQISAKNILENAASALSDHSPKATQGLDDPTRQLATAMAQGGIAAGGQPEQDVKEVLKILSEKHQENPNDVTNRYIDAAERADRNGKPVPDIRVAALEGAAEALDVEVNFSQSQTTTQKAMQASGNFLSQVMAWAKGSQNPTTQP